MTISMAVEARFTLNLDEDASRDVVVSHVDDVMTELIKLSETDCPISDPAVSLDLGRKEVLVELRADGGDFDEVAALVDSCLRSAIHAAGGRTPDWAVKSQQHQELLAPAAGNSR